MAQQTPAKRQKLTALAEKYGATCNDALQKIDPFISGLTPLDILPSLTAGESRRVKLIEKEQRKMFHGFTTAELHSIEALAPLVDPATTFPLNLAGRTIHTLFEKKRWDPSRLKHEVLYPLGKGRPGYWEAANPLVWEALEPCLRLSTLFIQNAVVWPWWDALIFGDYELLDKVALGPRFHSKDYLRVRNRLQEHWQRPNAAEELDRMFTTAAEKLHFQLTSGHAALYSGMNTSPDNKTFNPKQKGYDYGGTAFSNWGGSPDNVTISIGFEPLEPLMATNSTSGERAQDIFRMAATILHELAHAMFMLVVAPTFSNWKFDTEPFYEDECHMELGHSLENTLFHGLSTSFIDANVPLWSQRHLSCGGIFKQNWNTAFDGGYHNGNHPVLPSPSNDLEDPYYHRELAPIPVWFFLDICQADYWDIQVRQYQAQATVMGPTPIFQRISMETQGSPTKKVFMNQLEPLDYDDDIMDLFVSDDVTQAVQRENNRRKRSLGIQAAAMKQKQDRVAGVHLGLALGFLPPAPAPPAVHPPPALGLQRSKTIYFGIERGGIQLTPEEWDSFLAVCEIRKQLFTHTKTAMGVLRRIDAGWPTTPLPARPLPVFGIPSEDNLALFQYIVNCYALSGDSFNDGMFDHDKEHLRALCNRFMRLSPNIILRNENGRQLNRLSQRMFDSLLHQCHLDQECLTYGPEGIVRWIQPPRGPASAPPAPPPGVIAVVQPRPRITDTCDPM